MQQLLFPLAQSVTTERAHSLVCIPDRTTAEDELRKLRTQYRDRLTRAKITINPLSRSQRSTLNSQLSRRTYTLRYFTRETETLRLF